MRSGISRLELLTFIVCGVTWAALLLPGIGAANRDAKLLACQFNLRSLGSAFADYESARGGLPPRRAGFNNGEPYGGWGTSVIPFLEADAKAKRFDPKFDFFDPTNREATGAQPTAFLCPAAPGDRFITIQSQASSKSANPDKDSVYACRAAVSDFIAANGVLMTRTGYGLNALSLGDNIGNQRQAMTDNANLPLSKITDGLACTLLLIEQAGRPSVWRNGAKKDGDGQFGMSPNARGAWAGWGSIGFGAANAETGETPGRGDHTDCSVNCNNWFGIYGFHEGGANVLFCDGTVRFVGTKLDPLTFAYLTLRDDGHLLSPDEL